MRTPYVVLLMLFAAPAAFGGAANKSRLADTWWAANTDCYITDMVLNADGRFGVFYQDGRDAGGTWMLSGTALSLKFDIYDDTFSGRFTGSTIRAIHTWRAEFRDRRHQTEDCVFSEVIADGNPGGGI
jgi:hypothetical protein